MRRLVVRALATAGLSFGGATALAAPAGVAVGAAVVGAIVPAAAATVVWRRSVNRRGTVIDYTDNVVVFLGTDGKVRGPYPRRRP